MKRLLLLVVFALVVAACDLPYGAHMSAPLYPHVGYYNDTLGPPRLATWFDETGSSAWVAAQQTVHDRWTNLVRTYNSGGKHDLPWLDFKTSGGHAGCGNEPYGFDVCVGSLPRPTNDGTGRLILAVTYSNVDGQHHVNGSHIEVPPASYPFTIGQRLWVICHETGHVLGLAHNTANPASCIQASMPNVPDPPGYLGSDDVQELLKFYDGHDE